MDAKVARKPNGAQLNGHAPSSRRRYRPKRRTGFLSTVLSAGARILIWTAIVNVLFRCPSTLEQCDDSSPYGCKEYFKVKEVVSPFLQPYYDTHVSPYVDLVAPYYQTLDRTVITPAHAYTSKYVSPRAVQVKAFTRQQWEKTVEPQIEKAQAAAKARYDENIAPHVTSFKDAASPYLGIARSSALQTYYDVVLPTYIFVQPYAVQGYRAASAFATNTALPSAIWAFNRTWLFLDDTILPQLRLIYVQTVEPQLVRIGQRLGRHNSSIKTKVVVNEPLSGTATAAKSFFTKPAPMSSSAASPSSATSPTSYVSVSPAPAPSEPASGSAGEVPTAASPWTNLLVQPPSIEEDESEMRKQAREVITEDLVSWQEKFTATAENGAVEIKKSIVEICERMRSQDIEVTGKQTVRRFVDAVDSELAALRLEIMNIVETNTDRSVAIEQVDAAVRRVGLDLREKGHEIRAWREYFESNIHASINDAARDHFDMINSIQDMALQKIGMNWAWMDGVTYKDWKLFHLLRAEFEKWINGLEESIVTHPALEKAKNAASDVEEDGMMLAKDAAMELKRLKDVGHFKVIAGDSTDNFDTERMEKAALAAERAEATQPTEFEEPVAQEFEQDRSGGSVEDTSDTQSPSAKASIGLENPQSEDESSEHGQSRDEASQPEILKAQFEKTLLWDDAEAAPAEEEASFSTQVEQSEDMSLWDNTATKDGHSMVGSADEATEAVLKMSETLGEHASKASDDSFKVPPDSPAAAAESAVENESSDSTIEGASPEEAVESVRYDREPIAHGTQSSTLDDAKDEKDKLPPPSSSPTMEVKSALFGAAAQAVPHSGPVLDDDEDVAALTASASSMAHAAYSTAVSLASQQYSIAMSIVSAQIGATPKPVHQEMLASVSSAFDQAVASASSRLSEGLTAAKNIAVPTFTSNPVADQWAAIESIASEKLVEGRAWAEVQYQSVKIAAGLATPTPTSQTEKLIEQAKMNYYAGIGFAQARYEEFVAAASSALSSMTAEPTPTDLKGTVNSMASVATESAVSAASGAVSSAMSIASENMSNAAAAASEGFEDMISKLSVQVYGQPTPTLWYEHALATASSVASDAAEAVTTSAAAATDSAKVKFEEVSALVSELVVGKEPPFTVSVFSRLSSAYGQATESAASMASAASASVSTAVSEASEVIKSARDEL